MLKLFKDYLNSNNISIKGEEEISVFFNYSDLNYLFVFDENDPFYFRLILPNIMSMNEDNSEKIYKVINSTNLKFKVVKTTISGNNNIWISIESFVYSKENIDELFKRSMELLKSAILDFREELKNS